MTPLLKVEDLSKHLMIKGKEIPIIHPLHLEIFPGETLGLIGESGCGKSTLGKLILRLVPASSGRVIFEGTDILELNSRAMKSLRREMQIIFQDPYSSLNPRMRVQEILAEPYEIHTPHLSQGQRREKLLALIASVGMEPEHLARYPHELSGGQKQRVGIARALAINPKFIVCDEPLSALDGMTQHQVLELLMGLQRQRGMAYLFISHQIGAIKKISRRIAVMYLGRIVECGPAAQFFQTPLHPYSKSLLLATPQPDPRIERLKPQKPIQGEPPSFVHAPTGCAFHPRCPKAMPICRRIAPSLQEVYQGRFAACHFPESA